MDPTFASFRIDSLMRRHFIVVEPEDTVEDVLRLMALARVRILPVVSHGVLVGIVGYRALALSLLHGEPDESSVPPEAPRIGPLMEPPGSTLPAQAPPEAAARSLCESGHGCIPVVEPGASGPRLVGLVTENDLLEAAFRISPTAPLAPA